MSFDLAIDGQLRSLEALIISRDEPLLDACTQALPGLEKYSPSPSRKSHRFATGKFAKSWRVIRARLGKVKFVNRRADKKGRLAANMINDGTTIYGEGTARGFMRRNVGDSYAESWWYDARGKRAVGRQYTKTMNRQRFRGL